MKKNTVLSKILCVFKPKKTTYDILAEAENIINNYVSFDTEYMKKKKIEKRLVIILSVLISASVATSLIVLRIIF